MTATHAAFLARIGCLVSKPAHGQYRYGKLFTGLYSLTFY
jgi:hypothetical protein